MSNLAVVNPNHPDQHFPLEYSRIHIPVLYPSAATGKGGVMHYRGSRLAVFTTYLCCVLGLIGAILIAPSTTGGSIAHAADIADVGSTTNGAGSLLGTIISAEVSYGDPPEEKSSCTWRYSTEIDESTGKSIRIIRKMGDAYYSAFQRQCVGPPKTFSEYWVKETAHVELAKNASDKAFDNIANPLVGMAPPAQQSIVKVGTWFWVSRALWHPLSVKAYVTTSAGVLWVKTTATPSRIIYSPGDGTLGTGDISCPGPGAVWKIRDGDLAKSACMYTYKHASSAKPRGVFRARLSIEWIVKWKSNLGIGGSLPNVRTGVPVNVHVKEIQALAT